MPTPQPKDRIPALKKALANYGPKEKAPMRALAVLYGVTPARFSTLIKTRFANFPKATRVNDKTDQYPAREALESMIAYAIGMKKGNLPAGRRAARVNKEVAAQVAAEPEAPEPMTPSELDRLASALTRTFNLQKQMGLVVKRDEVKAMARGAFSIFSHEVMSIPGYLDPNGQLEIKMRTAMEHKCREILAKVHGLMAAYLEQYDDGPGASPAVEPTGRHRSN